MAVAERHCFPYGCFITFTFVCLFVYSCCFTMVLLFQLPLSLFFFLFYAFAWFPPPPCVILFFSVAALSYYLCISSNVNCHKRLVKTESACTHSCCVALWEYLCPYVFLWSSLFKCLEGIFSLCHPLPSFLPFVRAMVPKMVVRKQCSLEGKQRLKLWFACSTFIRLPVLSCCGCDALSLLHTSIHVSFFLLSL